MARHKRWYDPNVAASVHVIPQMDRDGPINPLRWKHPRIAPTLGECLIYPLNDGPGLGLLILLPPVLWILSLPIFDIIAVMHPLTKSDWAIGLLIVPILVPVLFSFSMTFGYALLFLGHMLVSSPWARSIIRDGPSGIRPISPRVSAAGSGPACSVPFSAASPWPFTGLTAALLIGLIASSSPS